MKAFFFILFFFLSLSVFSQETIPEKQRDWFRADLTNVPTDLLPQYWAYEMEMTAINLKAREDMQWRSANLDTIVFKKYALYLQPYTENQVVMRLAYEWVVESKGEQLMGTAMDLMGLAGYFQPVSGRLLLSKIPISPVLVKTTIQIWQNGKLITEEAFRIGSLGHKGSKPYVDAKVAILKGGNFVISSKEKAIELLEYAFKVIPNETGKIAGRVGYRIDNVAETAADGLKQGHQGLHINYYNKDFGIKGTIIIQ
jgi:hypothetical protein